jgi:hypothetical protein
VPFGATVIQIAPLPVLACDLGVSFPVAGVRL